MKIHDILKQKAVLKLILNQMRDVLSTGSSFDHSLLLVAATSLNAHRHQRDPTPLDSASSFFLGRNIVYFLMYNVINNHSRKLFWSLFPPCRSIFRKRSRFITIQTDQTMQTENKTRRVACLPRAVYATAVPSSSFSIFRCIELLLKAHISLKAPFPPPTSWCKFKALMTFEIRNRNGAFESLQGKTLLRKWSVEMPFKPVPSTIMDH